MKWVRASAVRPLLQPNLPEFWYQSPGLVHVRLLLFCFFIQKQRKTIQMSYGAIGADGRWSSVLYNSTECCKLLCQVAVFLLLGEHDRYSLLPSVLLWTAMVIAQPCLIGICPGLSISSTQSVITYNSKHSGDSMISLVIKQPSKATATEVAT